MNMEWRLGHKSQDIVHFDVERNQLHIVHMNVLHILEDMCIAQQDVLLLLVDLSN